MLLPHIERGTVRFIGATTHNPFFYINSPLVSRSQVFQLEPLTEADLRALLDAAIADPERGFGEKSPSSSTTTPPGTSSRCATGTRGSC